MHLYWRVREELRFLGEIVIFRDPALKREYTRWVRRHAAALGKYLDGAAPLAGGSPLSMPGIALRFARNQRRLLN